MLRQDLGGLADLDDDAQGLFEPCLEVGEEDSASRAVQDAVVDGQGECDSTYVRQPPCFDGMGRTPEPLRDIEGARVLALLGDSVTTDHISRGGHQG